MILSREFVCRFSIPLRARRRRPNPSDLSARPGGVGGASRTEHYKFLLRFYYLYYIFFNNIFEYFLKLSNLLNIYVIMFVNKLTKFRQKCIFKNVCKTIF